MRRRSDLPVLFGLLVALGVVWLALQSARAQDGMHGVGHAENHEWYSKLQSPMGYSCCNAMTAAGDGDCRPVRAFYDGENWKALVDGKWESVPANVILPDKLNKDPLHAHACRSRGGMWYCFLRGQAGG
jgi:hypothetical protein